MNFPKVYQLPLLFLDSFIILTENKKKKLISWNVDWTLRICKGVTTQIRKYKKKKTREGEGENRERGNKVVKIKGHEHNSIITPHFFFS